MLVLWCKENSENRIANLTSFWKYHSSFSVLLQWFFLFLSALDIFFHSRTSVSCDPNIDHIGLNPQSFVEYAFISASDTPSSPLWCLIQINIKNESKQLYENKATSFTIILSNEQKMTRQEESCWVHEHQKIFKFSIEAFFKETTSMEHNDGHSSAFVKYTDPKKFTDNSERNQN